MLREIEEDIPHVKAFPTDKKFRVVWAYGALILNQNGESNIPLVEVLLKEILDENTLSDIPLIIKITVAEIDIVRLGTIWCNRQRLIDRWNAFHDYRENMEFRFDFVLYPPESTKFIDKNPKTNTQYFPFQKYNLGNLPKNYGYKYHFMNATYTKLTTSSGTTILIHSLECLASTYVPEEKTIRYRLLNEPISTILEDYLEDDTHVENNIYYVHLKQKKRLSNIAFLSYSKLNQITRSRLSKLRSSIERSSEYADRYPIVLPYHPTRMKIRADGIWLNEDTFFVFRITGCTLPNENKIIAKLTKYDQVDKTIVTTEELDEADEKRKNLPPDDSEKNNEHQNNLQQINPPNVGIDSGRRPNTRNPSLQIISEVAILDGEDMDIAYIEETRTKDHYIYDPATKNKPKEVPNIQEEPKKKKSDDEENQIDTISAGEPTRSKQNNNVATITLVDNIEQSEILTSVEDALRRMKIEKDIVDTKNDTYINELLFLNTACVEDSTNKRPKFLDMLDSDNLTKKSWCMVKKNADGKQNLEGFRRFMLIKIVLSDGRYTYLLEIDRVKESESYSGLIFSNEKPLSDRELKALISVIIQNNGIYSKLNKKKKIREEIKLPVNFQMLFGHQKIQDSMYEKMKKVMNDACVKGAFYKEI